MHTGTMTKPKTVARTFQVWAPRTEVQIKHLELPGFIGRACVTDDLVVNYDVTYWHEGILRNVTLNEYAFDVLPDAKRIGFHQRTP